MCVCVCVLRKYLRWKTNLVEYLYIHRLKFVAGNSSLNLSFDQIFIGLDQTENKNLRSFHNVLKHKIYYSQRKYTNMFTQKINTLILEETKS